MNTLFFIKAFLYYKAQKWLDVHIKIFFFFLHDLFMDDNLRTT